MSRSDAKAISFTNSYCTLADGLTPGFEACLSENIVLDWFGKTINYKSNVAAFMNVHKVHSRHIFNKISSTSSIGYNKKPNHVRARRRSNNPRHCSNGNKSFEMKTSHEGTPKTPANKTESNVGRSRSSLKKISTEGEGTEENDITLELNDDDVSKMFKREKIQSTNIEEIEQKISQISLDDRLKLTSPRKRDFKEVNESENHNEEEFSMNYIEAYGEILFSKKSRRLSGWGEKKIVSSNITHTWRKPCKLQVAYTSNRAPLCQTSPTHSNESVENSPMKIRYRGPSKFDDVNEAMNHSPLKGNDLDSLLDNINVEEKQSLLKSLKEPLSKNEANKLGLSPKYNDDHLVFQRVDCDNYDILKNFICNHTIHVIIYEGRSRCRVNLSQKFI